MPIVEGIQEVLVIFDAIKTRLNELLINGVEGFLNSRLNEIRELQEKLKNLKMNLIVDLLDSLLDSIESKDQKGIAKNALKIISSTRMMESVISIELIKKDLISWVESPNAEGTDP